MQRTNGKVTLHDAGIVLYGRDAARSDRIYGQAFEYDQKNGVVQAVGDVQIDLQGMTGTEMTSRSNGLGGASPQRREAEPIRLNQRC